MTSVVVGIAFGSGKHPGIGSGLDSERDDGLFPNLDAWFIDRRISWLAYSGLKFSKVRSRPNEPAIDALVVNDGGLLLSAPGVIFTGTLICRSTCSGGRSPMESLEFGI
jgi:hypothetical protein